MANLPADVYNYLINAENAVLKLGGNTYILMQEMTANIEHPEYPEPTTAGTKSFYYGAGDNWVEFTLLMSVAEFATFNTNSQRNSNGALSQQSFTVVTTDVSGTSKTFTFTSYIVRLQVTKPGLGAVKARMRLRVIGDNVTYA